MVIIKIDILTMYTSRNDIEKELNNLPSIFPDKVSIIKTIENDTLSLVITFATDRGF